VSSPVARDLARVAVEVRIIELDADRDDGHDFTDEVLELLRRAESKR
jgi:hypothetical protein